MLCAYSMNIHTLETVLIKLYRKIKCEVMMSHFEKLYTPKLSEGIDAAHFDNGNAKVLEYNNSSDAWRR